MNMVDLTNNDIEFSIDKVHSSYWNYAFYAKYNEEHEYMQSLCTQDLCQLQKNCEKLLIMIKQLGDKHAN